MTTNPTTNEGTTTMTNTITTTVPATDDQMFDILTTALEGGYAEEFVVLDHSRRDSDSVIYFATVRCEEHALPDGTDQWNLDATTLRAGLQRYADWVAAQGPGHSSYLSEQFAEGQAEGWEYMDAIGADAVLQFATFGEVVFG